MHYIDLLGHLRRTTWEEDFGSHLVLLKPLPKTDQTGISCNLNIYIINAILIVATSTTRFINQMIKYDNMIILFYYALFHAVLTAAAKSSYNRPQ